jgi:hypothetical protein
MEAMDVSVLRNCSVSKRWFENTSRYTVEWPTKNTNLRDRRDRRATICQGRSKDINLGISPEDGRVLICASKKKTVFLRGLRDLRGDNYVKAILFIGNVGDLSCLSDSFYSIGAI